MGILVGWYWCHPQWRKDWKLKCWVVSESGCYDGHWESIEHSRKPLDDATNSTLIFSAGSHPQVMTLFVHSVWRPQVQKVPSCSIRCQWRRDFLTHCCPVVGNLSQAQAFLTPLPICCFLQKGRDPKYHPGCKPWSWLQTSFHPDARQRCFVVSMLRVGCESHPPSSNSLFLVAF